MIQDILTVKIERNIYVNEEKAVSEVQILINKTFLLFSHHELLMSFINPTMNAQTQRFCQSSNDSTRIKQLTKLVSYETAFFGVEVIIDITVFF